jgi:hypothetical protein
LHVDWKLFFVLTLLNRKNKYEGQTYSAAGDDFLPFERKPLLGEKALFLGLEAEGPEEELLSPVNTVCCGQY